MLHSEVILLSTLASVLLIRSQITHHLGLSPDSSVFLLCAYLLLFLSETYLLWIYFLICSWSFSVPNILNCSSWTIEWKSVNHFSINISPGKCRSDVSPQGCLCWEVVAKANGGCAFTAGRLLSIGCKDSFSIFRLGKPSSAFRARWLPWPHRKLV